jgi:hypothetical protein
MKEMNEMDASLLEDFASFGPWVDEVRELAEVPPLYRGHDIDFEAVTLVLKIPRNIDRRDANPFMDLYDALVIVDDKKTTILTRAGADYSTATMWHTRLIALTNSTDLLDGWIELISDDGAPVLIHYNGSSQANIERLLRTLRHHSNALFAPDANVAPLPIRPPLTGLDQHEQDYGLASEWSSRMSNEAGVELLAAYASSIVAPNGGVFSRATHRIRPTVFHGATIGASATELHVIHRRNWLRRNTKADISLVHTVVLRRSGAELASIPHPTYNRVSTLRITKGAGEIRLLVPSAILLPSG